MTKRINRFSWRCHLVTCDANGVSRVTVTFTVCIHITLDLCLRMSAIYFRELIFISLSIHDNLEFTGSRRRNANRLVSTVQLGNIICNRIDRAIFRIKKNNMLFAICLKNIGH